jgi:SHS2 domain-containing protein
VDKKQAGFREIEHTADWELEVWAPDLASLLEQAARGMYSLAGIRLQSGPRQMRTIQVEFDDLESLLINFLSELLFTGEQEGLAFERFDLRLQEERLLAVVEGAPITNQEKEIKAVTWHNLKVRPREQGLEVRIVFDV